MHFGLREKIDLPEFSKGIHEFHKASDVSMTAYQHNNFEEIRNSDLGD
ncbi:MAG TPA: hypothetical protein VMD99_11805 [Terriglobales bacterium]|nr:hypothetical protein [Terriglobales bacterium]